MVRFDAVLRRLVAAYECGRLVPFIGSGMSIDACVDWKTLVDRLEKEAKPAEEANESGRVSASDTPTGDLIRRANVAVRTLKSREPGAFAKALTKATINHDKIPSQTQALAELWWPLVLTTNYDNLYEEAFTKSFPISAEEGVFAPQYSVVGRSSEDCQRVLNSLSTPGRALIWALQGYFDAPFGSGDQNPALHEQLVIGHEQYRRVTYRDIHFRRAFAEVFRQRSMLFLGSGISETYLQELFGEVLELFGPSARPHYALIPEGEVDPGFMLARFQITVATYPKDQHQTVTDTLVRLKEEIERASKRQILWTWGRTTGLEGGVPELEVVRGPLPVQQPDVGHCLAVSAGGGERFFFSPGIREALLSWGVQIGEQPPEQPLPYLGYYPERHAYAVRARSEDDQRALSYVYEAASNLFRHAGEKYRCIHMQLLAAGGVDKLNRDRDAQWDVRPFPARFSFVQMVRAYADWRRKYPDANCRLVVHVVDPSVTRELASGRIDVAELLNCRDIRFWAEVVLESGEIERRLFQSMPEVPLDDIVREMNLSPNYWTVLVTPPARLEVPKDRPIIGLLSQNLQELGVVPGSTLHFRRPKSEMGAQSPPPG